MMAEPSCLGWGIQLLSLPTGGRDGEYTRQHETSHTHHADYAIRTNRGRNILDRSAEHSGAHKFVAAFALEH